jgi:hypothetical protein
VIFSRRGRSGRHARDDRTGGSDRPDATPPDAYDDEEPDIDVPSRGPYDVTEAPTGVQRLDLGSLQIPAVEGVDVRVQADPDGVIQQVVLVHGDSALQLGAFAAPRTEGIWDEVREEIRASLAGDGVRAEETQGAYGPELRAHVRAPEGETDLRFVGIDGPRWMVRAVYQGPAAADPAEAGPLAEVLDGLVVDRGQEAKPVREPLPLRLPRELAEQANRRGAQTANQAPTAGTASRPAPPPLAPPRTDGADPSSAAPNRRKPSPRPRRSS